MLGIDLGTTNSAFAFAAPAADAEAVAVSAFEVAQLVNPGEVRAEPLLPSNLFLPGAADFPAGSTALPWNESPEFVIGQLARKRGIEVPHRVVLSAKSWLSHAGVDRTAPILPLAAEEGMPRVSPAAASRAYLEHLRQAWDHAHPDAPLAAQQTLVTVPASFDAVARELTLQAAREAGYGAGVTLLEEPQAAFYAWIERHPDWRERVSPGDRILVVDVGGGTTDFSLIAVTEADGQLQLERVAVGEHILLGGDNMDLALAHFVQQNGIGGRKLDAGQFQALWQSARVAKEALLAGPDAPADQPVTILGRGSSLIGGTIRAKLARKDVERVVLEGFFPRVERGERPHEGRMAAFAEVGLPYAQDAAITRHLSGFLAPLLESGGVPTHVLFNGGVFAGASLRARLLETLNSWLPKPVEVLAGEDLMQAVARGAAYYGLARQGRGVRIRGGIARTYYIGVESAMPAVPGMAAPLKALTVAPFGMEEGTSASLPAKPFSLLVGQEADFRFFSSTTRRDDAPGEMLEEVTPELTEMPPVRVKLPAAEGESAPARQFVQVTLESAISATGQLELWCVAKDGRRWKLEFSVRERVRR
ncbi:MAG: Hsp70 family protein [Bryobacterales bacterium]|nr:Hsp70 family protein [Bryobacterales bacterium]